MRRAGAAWQGDAERPWGNAVSVLAGDLLLTHALERTAASAPATVLSELLATLRRLVEGEVVELAGSNPARSARGSASPHRP